MIWTISSILALSLQISPGTLGGRVVDQASRTVSGIAVQLLQELYGLDGTPELEAVKIDITNGQGEYRFVGFAAGHYYLRTGILGPLMSADGVNTGQAYPSTYYPGTTRETSALPVELTAESHVENVDILISTARLVNIRGRMMDAAGVRQPYLCSVSLVSAQGQNSLVGTTTMKCNDNGTFEFRDVIPGRYYIIGRRIDDAADRADAVELLEVGNTDVHVNLVSMLGSSISGRVRVDGSQRPELQLTFRPIEDPKSVSARYVTSNPRGTFLVPTLPVGKYRLSIAGLPEGYHVESVILDRTDVLSQGLTINGPLSSELVITLRSGYGKAERIPPVKQEAGLRRVVLGQSTFYRREAGTSCAAECQVPEIRRGFRR